MDVKRICVGAVVAAILSASATAQTANEGSAVAGAATPPVNVAPVADPSVAPVAPADTVAQADPAASPAVAAPVAAPAPAAAPYRPTQKDLTIAAADAWMERTSVVTLGQAGRVIQVFGDAVPTLVCHVGWSCNIELELGELVADTPVLSDTVRWGIEQRVRAIGEDASTVQSYIVLKPSIDATDNFLFIYTDRRAYSIHIVPSFTSHTPILAFEYPDTQMRTLARQIEEQKAERSRQAANAERRTAQATQARSAAVAVRGVETTRGAVPAEELHFAYGIRGNANFKPVRVYTDGQKTYVDLPDNYRGETPILIAGDGQSNGVVNIRVSRDGRKIIADRALSQFSLNVGSTRISITKQ